MLIVEFLFLSLPLPMLTVYLLHCCGETMRSSKLLRAVAGLWVVFFALLVSSPFIGGFAHLTPDNLYSRGPLYPLLLLPPIVILLLNLVGVIRGRKLFSRKVFHGFLVAILPMMLALTVQLIVDFYPLVSISYILSALSMYGFVLSDQIEQDRRQQEKIAHQQQEIIISSRRSPMNAPTSSCCKCGRTLSIIP